MLLPSSISNLCPQFSSGQIARLAGLGGLRRCAPITTQLPGVPFDLLLQLAYKIQPSSEVSDPRTGGSSLFSQSRVAEAKLKNGRERQRTAEEPRLPWS